MTTFLHWRNGSLPVHHKPSKKYSPDQPRDSHGRFGSGDGGGATAKPLSVPHFSDLSPELQGKIAAKLEAMTGMPLDALSAEMRDNLGRIAAEQWKVNPESAQWYHEYHEAGIAKAAQFGGNMTESKYQAMLSVTSGLNDPKDNVALVDGWAKMLAADPTVHVDQAAIDSYDKFASSRSNNSTPFQPLDEDFKPGDYHLSELPSHIVPSMVYTGIDDRPPFQINTGNLVKVVDIYRDGNLDDIVGGAKQRDFYNNLTNPDDPNYVTVDKWMYRAAMGDTPITRGDTTQPIGDWESRFDPDTGERKTPKTPQDLFQGSPSSVKDNYDGPGTYPVFAQAVTDAAKNFNDAHGTSLNPSEFQALVWEGTQGIK